MTDREKQSLKIRLGQRLSTDRPEVMEIVKEEINKTPKDKSIIKCQDCKYQVKEWRKDKRMKEKGYWVYGCEHFGEIMGYWGFGGYCSNCKCDMPIFVEDWKQKYCETKFCPNCGADMRKGGAE